MTTQEPGIYLPGGFGVRIEDGDSETFPPEHSRVRRFEFAAGDGLLPAWTGR